MKFLVALFAVCTVAYGFVPKLNSRIAGGEEVKIEDFPYQVSVRQYDKHICGGTILDEDTILTAAHCVINKPYSEYSVRVGDARHEKGIYHVVSEIRQHRLYDPTTKDHDISILKLSKKISFTESTQPVELQPRGVEVKLGTQSCVSGWGATYDGGSCSDLLRAVDVDIISNDDCLKKYGGKGRITERMICTHTPDQDFCQEDAGGPLVADGRLIGVASWGLGCALPEFPGVYTKVSKLYDWIQDNRY